MIAKQYKEAYLESIVFTASPEKLTLMLYSHLVMLIRQAQAGLEEKDFIKSHNNIVKAKKLIINFENTLDRNYKIADDLLAVYEYLYKRLTEANLKKDWHILEEILSHALVLRDTWAEAVKIIKEQNKQ
ncbi:flagellar biosynthetic protein FliS [Desulfosporosinus orientis DSM 765]|uniref:Flagellar secretion chaperone FliS n=1 Tax=Desulfosporosinus orientis (strain ATCC 19365 / DSM 765 / NCIMB 8382 / VKM B-1628 / Singapore I) TaxID=768706 RepID=G7WIU6_DESOD|nr:flagellar export chaperone FliS [Desulfosporosinus orientis]AET69671.1 flagellar biosynthetic protein FliS [Desulfosporosinus orientis DSM 765]